MEQKEVRGYKVFNPDWTCSPNGTKKQYTCPGKFEEDVKLECCERGMHFCEKAVDCFNYYRFDPNNKVAEVIAYGEVVKEGDKSCTNKLKIVREIPWDELLVLVNEGKNCTGLGNIGNYNSGDYNSGDYNSGDYNSGNYNSGDYNSGDYNSGDWNSGSWNSGNWNSGNYNSGNCNTGNCNTGNCNTGDWNKSSFNTGCFMTEEQNIMLFNKPSYWTYGDWLGSDANGLLRRMPKNTVKWINSKNMTEEEKSKYPTYKITGGYLKKIDQIEISEYRQLWWDKLSDVNKKIIKSLPNFDADVFKECTGITID